MFIVFNILVIFLTVLIAYWWATQGLFSAIIHLLCVVVAGAIALAAWEPLAMSMLGGRWSDGFVWGVSLVGVFVVVLFVLRLATNKLVPNNLHLPHWADLAFGGPVGFAAGVLTIGILILGAGQVQSNRTLLGWVGWGRSSRDGSVKAIQDLWLPCHRLTGAFYELLSVGAFSTSTPLRDYNPELYRLSGSLIRDSAIEGKGQTAMPEEGIRVANTWVCDNRCAVKFRYAPLARDFGVQLSITANQIRLITWPTESGPPKNVFPTRWRQPMKDGGDVTFQFDGYTNYITSVPGRETGDVLIEFDTTQAAGARPRFIQIKGTRYDLPRPEDVTCSEIDDILGGASVASGGESGGGASVDTSGTRIDSAIQLSNGINPILANKNSMPAGIKERELYLYDGDGLFPKGPSSGLISKSLRILGIEEPDGTKILQVNVSRGSSPADIFGAIQAKAGDDTRPALVDSDGNTYTAIGFIHEKIDGTRIMLDPSKGIRSMDELPVLPSSGSEKLRLVFRVTEGVTIVGFKLGEVTVGTCNVAVVGKARAKAPKPSGDKAGDSRGLSGGDEDEE